jgi:hypothetical protein
VGLFRKVKAAWDWNRFGLKLSRAKDAIEKELEMEAEATPKTYDFKKSLVKGLLGLLLVALASAAGVVATQFADSAIVAGQLESAGVSKQVSVAVAAVVAFIAEAVRNYLKNRDKQ